MLKQIGGSMLLMFFGIFAPILCHLGSDVFSCHEFGLAHADPLHSRPAASMQDSNMADEHESQNPSDHDSKAATDADPPGPMICPEEQFEDRLLHFKTDTGPLEEWPTILWDLDNGDTSDSWDFYYAFDEAGDYLVRIEIWHQSDGSPVTEEIAVHIAATTTTTTTTTTSTNTFISTTTTTVTQNTYVPSPSAGANPTTAYVGEPIQFSACCRHYHWPSVDWDLGNGDTSNEWHFYYYYDAPGEYHVSASFLAYPGSGYIDREFDVTILDPCGTTIASTTTTTTIATTTIPTTTITTTTMEPTSTTVIATTSTSTTTDFGDPDDDADDDIDDDGNDDENDDDGNDDIDDDDDTITDAVSSSGSDDGGKRCGG